MDNNVDKCNEIIERDTGIIEWCIPTTYWKSDTTEYSGCVSIQSNVGPLIMCKVIEVTQNNIRTYKRVPVKSSELVSCEMPIY